MLGQGCFGCKFAQLTGKMEDGLMLVNCDYFGRVLEEKNECEGRECLSIVVQFDVFSSIVEKQIEKNQSITLHTNYVEIGNGIVIGVHRDTLRIMQTNSNNQMIFDAYTNASYNVIGMFGLCKSYAWACGASIIDKR